MTKNLSHKKKFLFSKWAKQRDGEICIYCIKPLGSKYVLEHLNDNRDDNRLENYVNAHQACNISKSFNIDYQIIAKEKLQQNENALFLPKEDDEPEASTEIKISQNNFDITEQYITEKIAIDQSISWHDALYGSVYQCKRKTGYGSTQCARNYLFVLTSPEASFMRTKNEQGKSIISRRKGN